MPGAGLYVGFYRKNAFAVYSRNQDGTVKKRQKSMNFEGLRILIGVGWRMTLSC